MDENIAVHLRAGRLKDAAAAIKQAMTEGRVGRRAAAEGRMNSGELIFFAHVLTLAGSWQEVLDLMPPNTAAPAVTGWLKSIADGKPVNAKGDPIPWLTYPAIDFLDRVARPEWTVFEYGAGFSTLWWSRKVRKVVSVEMNAGWHQRLQSMKPANAEIELQTEPDAYANAILKRPETFDVIVIDGGPRSLCASLCLPKLAPGGILVFDNSDEPEHEPGVNGLIAADLYRIDFFGPIPSYLYRNCTTIFLRSPELLKGGPGPFRHTSSIGPSCAQATYENTHCARGSAS